MNFGAFLSTAEKFFPPFGSGPQIAADATLAESVQSVAERCAYELADEMLKHALDAYDSNGQQSAVEVWNRPAYRWARQYLVCRMAAAGEIEAIGYLGGRLGPDGMNL